MNSDCSLPAGDKVVVEKDDDIAPDPERLSKWFELE
jgi:hypothetical protein